jgi:uncharacterized protein YecT (DUF1311 family)
VLPMLLGALLASTAPETALHARWRTCTATKSNNYELGICAGPYLKDADAQLNATWRKLMAAVAGEPKTKAALLTEQRAWLSYPDTACAFYGVQDDWGRAGEVLDGPECSAEMIERRTAELAAYLDYVGPNGHGSR